MPNTTTNYSLYKPLVNDATDEDLWGGYLNDSMDLIDAQMKTNADAITASSAGQLPIGSLYWNKSNSANPATLLGYGTWTQITDKFVVARGSTYTGTGGSATGSATIAEANLPSSITCTLSGDFIGWDTASTPSNGASNVRIGGVSSSASGNSSTTGANITLNSVGSGTAISVDTVPPYQAAYCWERTA